MMRKYVDQSCLKARDLGFVMWGVKAPGGLLCTRMFHRKRHAIKWGASAEDTTWKAAYRRGWRVVKVLVKEI